MTSLQPDMLGITKQPAKVRGESERIWRAIMALRGKGYRVMRRGRTQHSVDGKLLSTDQLLAFASKAPGLR